jgi:hypothetical protein
VCTLADTLTVSNFTVGNTSGTVTINSAAGVVLNTKSLSSTTLTSGIITGTTKIVLIDTGTVSFPAGWTGYISNNIDINSTSTTFTGVLSYQTGTITYIAGTVDASACTLRIDNSAGLNTNTGVYWGNISVTTTSTITLGSNLNCSGTLTYPNENVTITLSGAFVVNTVSFVVNGTTGSFTCNGSTINTNSISSTSIVSGFITGTTKIVLTGTGTVSFPAGWSGYMSNNIDINSTSTTFASNFRYQTGTITYIAGTIDASACTLVLTNSTTLNTGTLLWAGITTTTTLTLTLASNLNANGTFFVAGTSTLTISGAFVVNTGTLNLGGTSTGPTLNAGTINTSSLTSTTLTSGIVTGTTKIILVGTGTVSFPATWSGSITNNIDINSASTTFVNNFRYSSRTIKYIAGTINTSASTLVLTGSCTMDTAGMGWNNITLTAVASTITLGSNLNCSGTLTYPNATITITLSGAFVVNTANLVFNGTNSSLTCNGGTINTNNVSSTTLAGGFITGTTKIVLTGTGTVSFPVTWSGYMSNNIDINSTSTTFTGVLRYQTGTITYIAGTVVVTNSTLVITAAATMNTGGMDWGNVTILITLTLTLTSAFTCSGTFTIGDGVVLSITGAGFWTRVGNLTLDGFNNTLALPNNLTVTGTLTPSSSTTSINGFSLLIANLNSVGTISGTTTIVFNGTGTWSGTGTLRNNTTINTAGTLTISGEARYSTGTLTYTAGTVDSSAGTLRCTAASTLNTGGMTWTNVTLTGTQTLSSNLNVSDITRITGTTTFVNTGRFTQTGTLDISGTCAFTLINNITVLNTFSSTNAGSVAQTMTGFQIICNGGLYTSGAGGSVSGTTTILLNGTGTWTSAGVSEQNAIRNNVTINTTGTITFVDYSYFNTGTLTYTAGTVVTTGSTLRCFASTTLNTNGISWSNIAFAGTITLSSNLTVIDTTLFGAGVSTFVNTGRFTQTGALTLVGSATVTLINNITVLGDFSATGTGIQTLNAFQLIVNGGIYTSGTDYVRGTTSILLNGTGTWTSDGASYSIARAIRNNVIINTAGTITFSGQASFNTGTLTYTAGTIVKTGSVLNCYGATTLNTNGISWNHIAISGTITLPSALTVAGNTDIIGTTTFTPAGSFTQTGSLRFMSTAVLTLPNNLIVTGNLYTLGSDNNHTVNGFQISVGGSLILSTTPGTTLGGTSVIVLDGTGTWSGAATVSNNISINTSGTITFSEAVLYSTGTLTYVAGTVNTAGSTLNIKGSSTLDTQGMQWGALDIDTAATVTLPSQLYTNDTIYLDSTGISFAGAGGFSCYGISQRVLGTITLESSRTFVIRNSFESISSNNTSRSLFQSSIPGTQAIMTLLPSATQSIGYVDATDIDSSLGQKIWSFKGNLNNATNWQELTALSTGTNTGTVAAESSYTWVS